MKKELGTVVAAITITFLFATACQTGSKNSVDTPGAQVKVDPALSTNDVQRIAEEAYIYGYPLVLMDVTREMMTNVQSPNENSAPLGQFAHRREVPDSKDMSALRPNADVLSSSAWLDLSREPVVLSLPDTGDRYYFMPLMSAWTDVFASQGSRTNGNKKIDVLVMGPDWQGKIPPGFKEVRSPTNDVWINGRTQVNGKSDYEAVHKLQGEYRLTPLSAWGTEYKPAQNKSVSSGVDMKTAPVTQVERMAPEQFFRRMARALKRNAPQTSDAETVAQMVRIGLIPGRDFDPGLLSSHQRQALEMGAKNGLALIVKSAKNPERKRANGWVLERTPAGNVSTYAQRAVIKRQEWSGGDMREDLVSYETRTDLEGQTLSGEHRYMVRFPKGLTPPVRGLWSLTLHTGKGHFAKNSLNRYAIHEKNLKYNADGSLDIYIQRQNPGPGKIDNWLPTPNGAFGLSLHTYWPKQAILNGQWVPPPVQKIRDFKNLSDLRSPE